MKKKEKIPTLNQDFDIDTFLTVLKKNVLWVIIFFVLAIVCGYLYYRYTQPTYSSSSVIQVKKENKTKEILGISSEIKIAPTIEIMRSEEFLITVVQNLPLGISFFTEGTFLENESYGVQPFNVEYKITNQNIYDTPIYYELAGDQKSYDITIGEEGSVHNILFDTPKNLPEGIELTLSAPENTESVEKTSIKDKHYFTINSERQIMREISKGLNISPLSEVAGTIEITFESYNARKSADIVNAIAEQFLEFDVMKNRESSLATIAYIDEQIGNVLDELSQIENQLQEFRLANGILNEDAKAYKNDVSEQKLSALDQRILTIEFELESLKEVQKEIQTNPDVNIFEIMALMSGKESNAFLSSMLQSLHELMSKRELLLFDVTENSHNIKVIDKQIDSKKTNISDFIESTIKRLTKEKDDCISRSADIKNGILEDVKYDELEYSKLKRIYSINEDYYSQLLKTKTELLISQSGFVSTNLVLEKANVPVIPISPVLSKSLLTALVLAFILSLLMIFVKYLFYNKILSTSDIIKFTDIPIIGEITTSRNKNSIAKAIVHKNTRSHITENLRKIRTNLDFYPLETNCRVIITTSTIPAEGKTFVALNLADIYAMSGKKVLIVDFDLRKPRLDQCFELDNELGVSTILTNRATWQECVKHNVLDNLDVITSGPVSPIAAELLISKNMETFIEDIRNEYDIIVLDTPPTGIIHDAITISKYANNIFYVMRSGISIKGYIEYLNGLIEEHNLKGVSIVLNAIPNPKHSSYGYGKYGYGYNGYGYGYSDDDDKSSDKKTLIERIFGKKNKSKK